MSLVIITGDGPEHKYVTSVIQLHNPVSNILICNQPARSLRKTMRRNRGNLAGKLLRELYLKAISDDRRRAASLRDVLGPRSERFSDDTPIERVGRAKGPTLAARIAELKPDVIAVYGTGIVPDNVLAHANRAALNMHTGLSPWYRGTACAFWPIYDNRPDMVGATVHECTSAVDGGSIYFRAPAQLRRGDDLHAVFARAVLVGARGYAEVVRNALREPLIGEAQDLSMGKEFRGSMRLLSHELKARRNLRRLSKEWPLVEPVDKHDGALSAIGSDA